MYESEVKHCIIPQPFLKYQEAYDISIRKINSYQKQRDTRIPEYNTRDMDVNEMNNDIAINKRESHTTINEGQNPYLKYNSLSLKPNGLFTLAFESSQNTHRKSLHSQFLLKNWNPSFFFFPPYIGLLFLQREDISGKYLLRMNKICYKSLS